MLKNYTRNEYDLVKITKRFALLLLLFATVMFSSCSDNPPKVLDKKIAAAIRSENNIDEKEWEDLTRYIRDNKLAFADFMEGETVDAKKLNDYVLGFSRQHRRQEATDPEIFSSETAQEMSKSQVEFYIENSASMDGYIRNTTEFEAALSDLLVQLHYRYDKSNLNVNFINTKIYPSLIDEVQKFVEALEPERAPYKIGDRTVSKLNQILEMILKNTSQENISILVSDCIYSLGRTNNAEGALEFEKSLTKGAFLEKSKQFNFATIVLKMKSKFTGKYWDKDNRPTYLNGASRPYYIWIMGSNERIHDFSKKINFKSLKGFEYSYSFSNFTKEKQPYYTVLKETNKEGAFKQADRSEKELKSINEVEFAEEGTLQLAVAVDLGNIPTDSSYLTNAKNYLAPEGFTVKSVEKINRNKLSRRDFVAVEKSTATHFITVSTTSRFAIQDLKLELLNKIPAWVEQSNSMNDADIKNELDKTFGLSYLIQGVSEAYSTQNPEQTSYFKIIITIKK